MQSIVGFVIPGNPWMGGVTMTGPNTGWYCGTDGTLYYFDGTTLTEFDLGTSNGFMALAMISFFNDLYNGLVAGDLGTIFQFASGNWSQVISPTTATLFCRLLLRCSGSTPTGNLPLMRLLPSTIVSEVRTGSFCWTPQQLLEWKTRPLISKLPLFTRIPSPMGSVLSEEQSLRRGSS